MSRRSFLEVSARGLLPLALAGCATEPMGVVNRDPARLRVRPSAPTAAALPAPGPMRLSQGSFGRGAILYVPEGYDHATPSPLLVTLHGRPGDAELWTPFYPKCDLRGIVMLAVESRGITWDLTATGAYGPDVDFIDWALTQAFGRTNIDPDAMALCGFSDGATYALSLGLTNGDLFNHLIAFAPGFVQTGREAIGTPDIWIAHGYDDQVFNEDYTEQQIVAALRSAGYPVEYVPFEGGHEVPAAISNAALDWFVGFTPEVGSA